jgi:hypothetical protein
MENILLLLTLLMSCDIVHASETSQRLASSSPTLSSTLPMDIPGSSLLIPGNKPQDLQLFFALRQMVETRHKAQVERREQKRMGEEESSKENESPVDPLEEDDEFFMGGRFSEVPVQPESRCENR